MNRALNLLRKVDKYLEKHKVITLLQWNAFLLQHAMDESADIIEKVKAGEK